MNLRGSIDLLKLNNVWAGKIESKKQPGTKVDVLIIPVRDNDIYQSVDEATGKLKSAYLSLSVLERREVGQFGDTHNVRPGVSSNFKEQHPELAERLRSAYLGNMKPFTIESAPIADAPVADIQPADLTDDLPF